MNETIRNRTARSSLTLLRATLQTFRSLDVTDPAQAPRVIKTAELLSMTAKKLGRFLTDEAPGEVAKKAQPPEPKFDVFRVANTLSAIREGRICACGCIKPAPAGASTTPEPAAVPEESRAGAMTAVRRAENSNRR